MKSIFTSIVLYFCIFFSSFQVLCQTVNFNFTGGVQTYTVPPCVNSITVDVRGAQGGGPNGGNGARVTGTISVTPGQVLQIYVGGAGGCGPFTGGFNGGGHGQTAVGGYNPSCGGGGASDIRTGPGLSTRLVVAAGGGGRSGGNTNAAGGAGGCATGNSGTPSFGGGGGGGTQFSGGGGGSGWAGLGSWGQAGSLGQGGNGANDHCYTRGPGGGGGGGFYGGGGGGADCWPGGFLGGGGGGGGSSLVPPGGACQVGFNSGNGFVSITPNFSATGGTAIANPNAVCAGQSSTISLAGHSGSIQWQVSTNGGATWANVPGATGTTLNTGPLTVNTCYRAAVTCGNTVFSTMACVNVNAIPTANFSTSSANACVNGNVTLNFTGTAPAGSTFAWNCNGCAPAPGATAGPWTTSWSTPGVKNITLTVTGPAPTNCVSTPVTAAVNVVAPPTSTFSASSPVCAGGNATLTYTGNAPAGSSFAWNCNGCTPAPGTTAGPWTASWSTSGVKTLTLTVTGPAPTNCVSAVTTQLVTVNANPTSSFNVNPNSTCINTNATITFTGSALPGATYTWNCDGCSSGNPSGQGPHTVSWGTTGTKTVTLTVSNPTNPPCVSTQTAQLVTINPAPTSVFSVSQNTVCQNNSSTNQNVTLTYTGTGGVNFTWNCGGCAGGNPSGQGPHAVSWATPGVKTLTLQVNTGGAFPCVSSIHTVLVTVNSTPLANFSVVSPICSNTAISNITSQVSVDNPVSGGVYTWNCGGCVNTPTGVGPHNLSWTTGGNKNVTLQIVDGNNCTSPMFTQTVVVHQTPTASFSATPNPICGNTAVSNSVSTITFTGVAGAGATFNWNCDGCAGGNPSGQGPHALSWASAGSKTLTLNVVSNTAPACQSPTATSVVTVNATPQSNFNVSANNICAHPATATATTSLNYTPPNPGLTLAGAVFTWNCDGCITAPGSTQGPWTVSWLNATSTLSVKTVTLQVANPGNPQCVSAITSILVTVNPTPPSAFTVSSSVICGSPSNQSITTLTYTSSPAALADAVYTWNCDGCLTSPGNTAGPWQVSWTNATGSATVKTISLTVSNPGTAPTPTCISPTTTLTVTVNPTPTSGFTASNSNICADPSTVNATTTITFTQTPSTLGGAVYAWDCDGCLSGPLSTTAGPHTVSWLNATSTPSVKTLTLSVTNPGTPACNSGVTSVLVTVHPTPTGAFTSLAQEICSNTSTVNNSTQLQHTASASTLPGASFNWSCGGCIGGVGNGPGPHTVSWTNTTGSGSVKTVTLSVSNPGTPQCISPTFTVLITVNPTPTSAFSVSQAVVCADAELTVTFTMPSPTTQAGATYTWGCDGCYNTPPSGPGPHQVSWPSSMVGTRTLSLTVQNPGATGCTSPTTTQVVEVIGFPGAPLPQLLAPTNVHGVICLPNPGQLPGASTTLFAQTGVNGDQVRWYTTPSGPPSHFYTGNQYVTPILTTSTTYYLTTFSTVTGCESSPRVPIIVEAYPIPSPPTSQNQSRCGAGVLTLTAVPGSGGTVVRWYDTPSGGQPRTAGLNGLSFTSDTISISRTYYISTFNPSTTCESSRVPVTAIVHPIPGIPQAADLTYCYNPNGNAVTFTVLMGFPSGNEVRLYSQPQGGNIIDFSNQLPPFELVDTIYHSSSLVSPKVVSYYISSFNAVTGCESPRIPAKVTINPIPALPLSTNEKRCGPGPVTFLLNMGFPAGNVARLYSVASGGVALDMATAPIYQLTTPILSAAPPYAPYVRRDTFYIESEIVETGCKSGRSMYLASVYVVPAPPSAPKVERCGPGVATFTAVQVVPGNMVAGNSIRVYEQSDCGGSASFLMPSPPYIYTTPVISTNTTFYLRSVIDSTQCGSLCVPIEAIVHPYLHPPTVTSPVVRCGSGSVVFSVQTGFSTPGLVEARLYDQPVGGSVISTDAFPPYELASPSVATTTTFYVGSYLVSGNCQSSARVPAVVKVERPPDTAIVASARRCGPGVVGLYPKFSSDNGNTFRLYTQATGGTYIEMDNLAPYFLETNYLTTTTTFYVEVYNSVTGCVSLGRRAVEAIIDVVPGVATVSDTFRCEAGEVVINAEPGNPLGSELRLYDAPGGGQLLQAVSAGPHDFTLPAVSTSSTYYVESYHSNGCRSARVPVKVEIRRSPGLPWAEDITVCGGTDNTVLFASMGQPSGVGLGLYEQAQGGAAVSLDMDSPYQLLLPDITYSATYYLGAISGNGCAGPRRAVKVNVLPLPSSPDVLPVSRCGSGVVTFTAQMGLIGGTEIRLYTVGSGGNAISRRGLGPYELGSGVISTHTTFYLEVYDGNTGCSSSRVAVGATVNALPLAPSSQDIALCGGGVGTFTVTVFGGGGNISVRMYTQAVGGVPLSSLEAGPYLFTTPFVSTTTSFYFEVLDLQTGCSSSRFLSRVQVLPVPTAPIALNASRCGVGVVTLGGLMTAVAGDELALYSQSSGGAALGVSGVFPFSLITPPLANTTTFYISARHSQTGCESGRVAALAIVHEPPLSPVGSDVSRCGSGSVTLSVLTGQPVPTEVRLYNQGSGGAILMVDKTEPFEFRLSSVMSSTTYYVESYNEATGCVSGRSAILVSILERPTVPSVSSATRCGSGALTFTAFPGGGANLTIGLYSAAEGGVALATTNMPPYHLSVLGVSTTTTFYASSLHPQTGCQSERVAVVGTIYPIPGLPLSSHITRCGPGVATFSVVSGGLGDIVRLYDSPVLGNVVDSDYGEPYLLQTGFVSGDTTFFAESESSVSGCRSARVALSVRVLPIPPAPSALGVSICGGGSARFTAQVNGGGVSQVYLYDSPSGGSALGVSVESPFVLETPLIATTTTFYLSGQAAGNTCESGRSAVVVTVHPVPGVPSAVSVTRCGPGVVTFSAIAGEHTDEVRLYGSVGGQGVLDAQSVSPYFLTTPVLSSSADFYIEGVNSLTGCQSGRRLVRAVVEPLPSVPVASDFSRCGAGGVEILAQMGSVAGDRIDLYSLPQGGAALTSAFQPPYALILSNVTQSGVYYLESVKSGSGCRSGARLPVTVTIHPLPVAPQVSNIGRCGWGSLTFTAYAASLGSEIRMYSGFSASTPVSVASSSPYLLRTPTLTSSTVYYFSVYTPHNGCVSERVSATAFVHPLPGEPRVEEVVRCGPGVGVFSVVLGSPSGDELRLYDSPYGGSALSTSSNGLELLSPFVTTHTTFYISVLDKETGCQSSRVSGVVRLSSVPSAPLASSVSRCGSGVAVITGQMGPVSGSELRLYSVPFGGEVLSWDRSAPYTLATPELAASATYYVESVLDGSGCQSERVPVAVNILPLPQKPLVSDAVRCGGGVVSFSVASLGGGDVAELYDALSGGVLVSSDNSLPYVLTTPFLGSSQSFFVGSLHSSSGCRSERVMVRAIVNAIPGSPTVQNARRCGSGVLTFTASMSFPAGSSIRLFDLASGGVMVASAVNAPYLLQTPVLNTNTTYYAEVHDHGTGCSSVRVPVFGLIDAIPDAPLFSPIVGCGGGLYTFSVQMGNVAGTEVRLYNSLNGGSLLASDHTFPFSLSAPFVWSTTTFYISALVSQTGCESFRVPAPITIVGGPSAPSASGIRLCGGGIATITGSYGSVAGDELRLYDAFSGGVLLASRSGFGFLELSVPVSHTVTYYLEAYNSQTGCGSVRTPVVIEVFPRPGVPLVGSVNRCGAGAVTFSGVAGSPAGDALVLYSDFVGGQLVGSDVSAPYEISAGWLTQSATYYASMRDIGSGCESERVPVSAQVYALPGLPEVASVGRCGPGSVIITALAGNPAGDVLSLYDSEFGGSALASDFQSPYELPTPLLSSNTVFYVESRSLSTGCRSLRRGVEVTVTPLPLAPLASGLLSRCGPGVITFNAVSASGGEVYLYGEVAGGSPLSSSTSLPYELTTPFLTTSTVLYIAGGNLATGCVSSRVAVKFTVHRLPDSPLVGDVYRCGGGSLVFSPTVTQAGVSEVRLYDSAVGGGVLAVDNSGPYTLGTPALASTTKFYFESVERHSDGRVCVSERSEARAYVHLLPGLPVIAGSAFSRCGGGFVTISAQMGSPGGSELRLYASMTGGSALAVDSSFPYELVTPFIASTATFYVASRDGVSGCEGGRVAVPVVVHPALPSPWSSEVWRCGEGVLTFSVFASDISIEGVSLYDAMEGGNRVSVSASLPFRLETPYLTSSTTFYLEGYSGSTGCRSGRVAVTASILPSLGRPSAAGVARCDAGPVTFTAQMGIPSGSELRLFSHPSGVAPLAVATAAPYLLSPGWVSANSVFYLESYNGLTGCASERVPVSVSITSTPSAPFAFSDSPLCLGQSLNLSASGSESSKYIWSGPGGFSATGSNVSRSSIGEQDLGVYSVIAVNGACSSSATLVSVRGKPTPLVPEAGFYREYGVEKALCAGEELNLEVKNYALYPSGTEFRWYGPDTLLSLTHPFPSLSSSGTIKEGDYYVIAINEGCTSAISNRVTVLIRPLPATPAVSSNGPLCAGSQPLRLYASEVLGAIYLWTGPNGFSSTERNPVRPSLLVNAGVYTVRAITEEGRCTSLSASVNVDIRPVPAAPYAQGVSSLCAGEELLLTATGESGLYYLWRGPGGFTAGGFSGEARVESVTPAVSGVYSAVGILGGCTSGVSTVEVKVKPRPSAPVLGYNGPLCAGQTLKIEAFGVNQGLLVWRGPGGYVHTGAESFLERGDIRVEDGGVYRVAYEQEGCLSEEAELGVEVLPVPLITGVKNSGPHCVGDILELEVSGTAGASYSWSGPGGFSAEGSQVRRLLLNTSQGGVYSVAARLGNCVSAVRTSVVTVNARPSSPGVTNNSPVCLGRELEFTLSAPAGSSLEGATYLWLGPGGFSAAGASTRLVRPNVGLNDGGVYSVAAVIGGCTSSLATSQVIITPAPATPVAGNTGPYCEGETITLQTGGVPGAAYRWSGPGGFTASGSSVTVTRPNASVSSGGVYSVQAFINGCGSAAATTQVVVLPRPGAPEIGVIGATTQCVGQHLRLTAGGPTGMVFLWEGPRGFAAIGSSVSRLLESLQDGGSYNVIGVVNGCTSAMASVNIVVREGLGPVEVVSSGGRCVGSQLTLTASALGATIFTWSGPNNFSASGSVVSRLLSSVADGGVYTVTASNGVCVPQSATLNVSVSEVLGPPFASSNAPLCGGGTLQLEAEFIAGARYQWSGPGGFSSALRNPQISNVSSAHSGLYTVFVTQNGCRSQASEVVVSVLSRPLAPSVGNNGPLCAGSRLSLTASGSAGVSYYWTGPGGWSSNLQNPVIESATTQESGVYNVIAVNGPCSSGIASTQVVVNPTPSTPVASSNGPLCAGQTLQLNASSVLGASYIWTGPSGYHSALQNPSRLNAGVNESGEYAVRAVIGRCSSEVSRVSVLISPVPSVPRVSSNSPLCEGETLQLTASGLTGVNYTWSGPLGFSSQSANPVISGTTTQHSGVYSLTASVAGCTSAAATTSVQINRGPGLVTAGSNSPVCAGSTILLTAPVINGASYSWVGPNGFRSLLASPRIEGALATHSGVYSLTVAVGSCSSSLVTTVLVTPQPLVPELASNGPVCEGDVLYLSAVSTPGARILWQGPSGFSAEEAYPVISSALPQHSGFYEAVAILGACTSEVARLEAVVRPRPSAQALVSQVAACEGESVELPAGFEQGVSYSWSGPGGFSSNLQSPTLANLSAAQAGVYTLTPFMGKCAGLASTVRVVAHPTPKLRGLGNNGPICAGQTLRLSASAEPGVAYRWVGPSGFSAEGAYAELAGATVSHSGVYSVTAILGACTSQRAEQSVVVRPLPLAGSISSNGPLCSGQTLHLSVSGGTIGAQYLWSGPNGFSASVANPSIASVSAAYSGVYSLAAIVEGCTSLPSMHSVHILPSPELTAVGSNSPLCSGSALNLTASFIPGASYYWVGPSGFVRTEQNPSLANVGLSQSGTYFVAAIVEGCTSAARSVRVEVNRSPSGLQAGNNGPLCEGQAASFTASGISGARYLWSGPGGYSSQVQNPTISSVGVNQGGVYSVVAIVNGCTSAAVASELRVEPSPGAVSAAYNGPICEGQSLALSAWSVGGAQYYWSGPNGFQSLERAPVLGSASSLHSGVYSVVAILGACSSSVASIDVEVLPGPSGIRLGSNSPVCGGGVLNLTATLIAGAQYYWSGPGGFSSTLNNPSLLDVTTLQSGAYSLVAQLGSCRSEVLTTLVTVTPSISGVVAGNNGPICSGDVLNLTASAVLGARYYWTGPNNFTSWEQNPSIGGARVLDAGVYSVYAYIGGCTSAVSVTSVTVKGVPTIDGFGHNGPLCAGSTLSLTGPSLRGATYIWRGPGGLGATVQNPVFERVSVGASGEYSLTVVVEGCASNTVTRLVEIRDCDNSCPAPVGLVALPLEDGRVRISWELASGSSRLPVCYVVRYGEAGRVEQDWRTLLVPFPESGLTLSGLSPSTRYELSVQSNCAVCGSTGGLRSDWSERLVFGGSSSRKAGFLEESVWVYPNPSSGLSWVAFTAEKSGLAEVRLHTLEGRVLLNQRREVEAGFNEYPLDMRALPEGVYLLEVSLNQASYRVKIVKR